MEKKLYSWPDLSPVLRRFVVRDDSGRFGIATSDPVYHPGTLFAHPVDVDETIQDGHVIYMTTTPFSLRADGTYIGVWYDYSKTWKIPDADLRRLVIVSDLGVIMPDRWVDAALAGSEERGHWDYGATIGKVGGDRPVKGQKPGEMTVDEAVTYAGETGTAISARGIRRAADAGYIPGARKIGRDWLIPYDGYNHYLDNRPKRGRKAPGKDQNAAPTQ